jgi:ribonucleoside-triphosphate reductase
MEDAVLRPSECDDQPPQNSLPVKGDDVQLFSKIAEFMEMAVKAHLEKKRFIEKLLSLGEKGPLALLAMDRDGAPYLRMPRASFLIGMVGLNELVQIHTGQELHSSRQAFKFGLKVIAHMKLLAEKLSQRHGMRFVLEQTPAESTAYRFAKLDLNFHSPKSAAIVKGDLSRGEIYYTNSTHLNPSAVFNPIDRVRQEGLFHPLIEAGALTHLWLGEAKPSPSSLASFVVKTFQLTQNDQIAFSPEFTTCNLCHQTCRGLLASCPYCGSKDVDGITRITGYFTKVSSWNKGKLGELRNRYRNQAFSGHMQEATVLQTK